MFHQSSLLAIGFTNLAMLGWLAAAAAPLLIHLWSRHRFREAPWAAMQFLLAAMRKNARRMQLQQWLLLALRTLLILLVVLAVAEPYSEKLVAGGATTPAHKVLVIDGSMSMALRNNGASNFERAKNLASKLVLESRAGDAFTVILMARRPEIIVGLPSATQDSVAAQIESLRQTHAPADLPATLAQVQHVLVDRSSNGSTPPRQEVYFFTDLQRSTWQAGSRAASQGDGRRSDTSSFQFAQSQITALSQHAALFVIDVAQTEATNLAVTRLATSEPFVTVNREVPWEVTLHQFGAQPLAGCRVELLVDDVAVGEQTVDIPAQSDTTLQFSHRFTSTGAHTLAVRAAGDQLEPDNARWLVVPVRKELRVLCIEGREGAARYVADALDPNPASPSAIVPIVASEGDLAERQLADFDCIVLCNVAQLTSSEAQRLARFAAGGGGVIFFLGDRIVPEAYNRLAAASHEERGNASMPLLPVRIGELVSEPQFGLDPLDYRHPIVGPFRGSERAGLLTTPVSRYYRLELPENLSSNNIEVAAAIGRGDPFIVTSRLGKGRAVVVATDASLTSVDPSTGEAWTIWPTWPSFLPIIREMLAFAICGQHEEWQQPVGTPLASGGVPAHGAMSSHLSNAALKIQRPDGSTVAAAQHSLAGGMQWSYDDTNIAGIYSLVGSAEKESQQFAVNVDTRESDLAKADPQQLPRELVVRATPHTASDGAAQTLLAQTTWSERLLWVALTLLFIDSFLAWRFGRGSA